VTGDGTPSLFNGDMVELACPVRSMQWRDGRLVGQDVPWSDLAQVVADPDVLVWVDLLSPSDADLGALAREMDLGQTAVEDALAPHERPKVTRHGGYLFFTTYATALGQPGSTAGKDSKARLRLSRVSGFVMPSALVTVRLDDGIDIDQVVRSWSDNPDLLRYGTGALVHGLMDHVVDSQFATIQALDDQMEGLEDDLLASGQTSHAFVREVYRVRKDLVQLRRVVLPMREVVNGLLRHRSEDEGELSRWYDDLYDHVLRASEWTESLRDMVTTVFETNLSLQDLRLNVVMKKLAAWAAIIAVPTAVTGWFGQNVPYLGFSETLGVWESAGLILVLSVGLYIAFKRRDWL
jgi:magnesium transporter